MARLGEITDGRQTMNDEEKKVHLHWGLINFRRLRSIKAIIIVMVIVMISIFEFIKEKNE